ncbi:centrosomal protein of 170 kDa-like isoform X2 [Lytechinus variegatus]|uniref:centrosomal protein of 170 kDa-like isoform X2 n=1 Tax=Lytechinus variegatus TaxID=7654 RepID=UPI001BB2B547|nr:centrosomal protein of 170 kDa-like isoform X2 [Lytechinus variegatus]
MAWCLVANTGMLHILQQDLMLIGRDQCDISIQSRSVDKQHSVIAYDQVDGSHSIKDVGSLNGTFVNDSRIPEETYIQLKKGDSIRFGYDPITYRFDSLQLDNISVVKDQEGFIKQEMNDLRDYYYEVEEDEEYEDAFLTRQSPPDYNQSLRRAMQKRNAKESRNTYGKQASLQDQRPTSHGSPLYGQPAWWGESEDPSLDGSSTSPDDLRPRANTYSTQGSSDDNHTLESPSPHERPSRLPSNEPERDIPVVIYNRSDRRPVHQETPPHPQPQAEITLMASSEKAIGFTIDFGSNDDAAPKMARPDSLQNCIPQNVRQKIEKSTRMMEELKAERLMKKSQEEEAVMQSPRASPLSSRTDGWSGVGQGGRRTPKGTPETPSPGYQGDVNFQQMQRKNKSSNCLSEPLPPTNLRQRTFVKSSHKSKPNQGSPSPITPVSPGMDTEEDSQYQEDVDGEVDGGGGDDVSETGTYTIESDSQSKEVQEARERIDEEFGVETEEKVPSDDDTDKDVGDEEMEEEEVFTGKQNGGTRLDKVGPGLRVRGDGSSRTAVDKIDDIEGKHKGGPGTPQWVQQWATMTTNSALPTEQNLSPDRHGSPDHIIDGYDAEQSSRITDRDDHISKKPPSGTRVQTSTPRTAPLQSPDSSSPRGSRGKRILPTTPAEKLQTARQSSTSSSSEHTMRQNGFQASNSSAFHSPRNRAIEQQQQQEQQRYLQDRAMEEKAFGKRRQLHGSSDPIVPMGYQEEEARRDSWGPEGSMDTDVLLKDTETLMRNLEERMRTKRQDTPSPEMSDSHDMPHDVSQDISVVSFEADVDTDVDTASNVSLVGGNNTWAGSKSRHYSCPEDNTTSEHSHYTNGRQKVSRSVEKPRTTQADTQNRSSGNKTTPAPAKGGIWSRLSTPNKHKMQPAEKEAESVSDTEHSFRRNTHLTSSLPTGRISNRTVSRGASENTKAVKKPKSLKPPPNLSQPRQTRSTMLRKNRFSEDSGADHSDISPSSSMSDLSSSKNFRRGGSMRETRSGAVSDSGRRTPVERGRGRTSASSARNGDSSARTDHSLGSQIARHARTQSMQDQKTKTAEPRSRLPTSASHNRTPSGNLSRKSSIGSTDSNVSGVRKTSSGAWRRYDTADDSDHDVDNYIKNVSTRRTATQNHQSEERQQAPVIQRQKSSSLQNLQTSPPRTSPTRKPPNLRVEIAQASNTLAQNLQRLAQGESIDEIQIDRIPKEQLIFHFVQMMDELLSEDSVHLNRQDIWQGERFHPQVPLQRSSSLSFQPDQTSQGLAGSPPIHIKKKPFNKSESANDLIVVTKSQEQDCVSFDSLVLSSIHHLSIKMKDSADKIAYKLKKLQQPGASEDELSKVLRDSDFPLLKTNNKEIAGILQNLRKMEKRLEEIHGMVDPRNEIKLPEQLSPVNQMRRQYATEFNFAVSDSEAPLPMTTRHIGRAPVNTNLQRQRHTQQQQQQQQQQQYQEHDEEEYYL